MFAHIVKAFILTHDQKAVIMAYLSFSAITAGAGYFVVNQAGLWPATTDAIGFYEGWMVVAAGLAGVASLYIARGWIGLPGVLGSLRACIGTCVMLVLASLIAGTLIVPVYGTFYAPFMVLTALLQEPLIAGVWLGGVFVAHRLLAHATIRRRTLLLEQEQRAMSSLSPLSQASFYRK